MVDILGINAYHGDAAACLVRDGDLVAAAEEERFRRMKHWAGFPSEAIRYCLEAGGLRLDEVEHVAVNRDPQANLLRRAGYALLRRPSASLLLDRARSLARARKRSLAADLEAALPGARLRGRVHHVEHHLAHLASAGLVAPFEECLAVSVDQFGDFASTAWGRVRGPRLEVEGRIHFPHSLGTFYTALTQLLGFSELGDEFKVMGLAAYGEPRHLDVLGDVLRTRSDGGFALDLSYFRHHREPTYIGWADGSSRVANLYSERLEARLGPRRVGELGDRHRDLARSVQAAYEGALFNLLRALHARYRLDDLALAGGCAMNSVANGKIERETPFRRVFVQPAGGDAGGALGAAMAAWQRVSGRPRTFVMNHAAYGPEFGTDAIAAALDAARADLAAAGCTIERLEDEGQLCQRTATAVAAGGVVGWFQGRMEWGPRALGNRSILCDPRRADVRELLNAKIKRREPFRPFAASVLAGRLGDWFEADGDEPFMTRVFPIRADARARIPAVTHVDGSGRVQTVARDAAPRFRRLLEAFGEATGVPLVLNTSFNESEPIVCRPEEALDCFLRTRMDVLVLGDHVVERRPT